MLDQCFLTLFLHILLHINTVLYILELPLETFIEREQGEIANDRNDRAIRVAAKWYTDHLSKAPNVGELKVVLLTNVRANKEKAEQSGLYSDIIVHRLLAVAINADSTYPDLMDKHNYRHKMAQYAQRASVAFHTQLFFKNRGILNEEGFILFVRKNAIIILIPKFGLEGTVFFKNKDNKNLDHGSTLTLRLLLSTSPGLHTFHIFDKVKVTISLDASNIQHQKIRMALVEPVVLTDPSQKQAGESCTLRVLLDSGMEAEFGTTSGNTIC
uniref:DIS3 exosome endoribonuclease and 3'-5' exoribonuclease n=1 Tax=Astyanax mexicanus TaxID=7994 RepID=A0A8B9K7M1_ASTMX